MKNPRNLLSATMAVLAFAGAATAQAATQDSIALQFQTYGIGIPSGDFAGADAVSQDNWNVVNANNNSSFSGVSLVDNAGNATTAVFSGLTNGPYADAGQGFNTATDLGDAALAYNEINSNGTITNSDALGLNVTISSIPFALYDVYVYVNGDTAGRSAEYDLTAGGTTLTQDITTTQDNSSWVEGSDYLLFSDVSGSSLTLNWGSLDGSNVPLNGIQIVAAPEPSTWALLAAGLVGGAVLLRRRQSLLS